jgi:alginate O-acetyltransferase complex protein AlgJ
MRAVRIAIAAAALIFFFGPLGLRAVGVTARPFENRPMATFPKPSQGWDALEQGKRFFIDRLPLREQAVHADAWISRNVFDTAPAAGRAGPAHAGPLPAKQPAPAKPAAAPATPPPGDKALAGKDGWLYLEGETNRACYPFIPWPRAVARWERLASIIRRSGRRVVVAIPADKSSIYPEYLPATYALRDCAPQGHRAAWRAIEAARDPAILGLRRTLLEARRPPPEEAYYRKDTHWNTKGGVLGVQAVLERIGDVTVRPGEIVKERTEYTGDLTNLSGSPETDTSPAWTIRRGRKARTVRGRALFVYDSYGTAMLDALQAYAPGLAEVQWFDTPPAALIAAIRQAETVILETVEREVNFRASDSGLLTPAFLREVRRGLG